MVRITCTVDVVVEYLVAGNGGSHSHVLSYGLSSTDVWQLSLDGRQLVHRAALENRLNSPKSQSPIIDSEHRGPIIDAERRVIVTFDSSRLEVFDLDTGTWLHKVRTRGGRTPVQYSSHTGRALVAMRSKYVVLDVVGYDGIVASIQLPPDLAFINDIHPPDLQAVYISDSGSIVCSFMCDATRADSYILLLWSSPFDEGALPMGRVVFPFLLDNRSYIFIYITTCIPMSSDTFLFCVVEEFADLIWGPDTRISVLRLTDTHSLAVRWTAMLSGVVVRIRHVAESGLILVFGWHNPDTFSDDDYPEPFIAALDGHSGRLLRMERIPRVTYDAVSLVSHLQSAVVVLYEDGSICTAPFDEFVAHGLPREGDKLAVVHPWAPQPIRVVHAVAANTSIVVATSDTLCVVEIS